MLFINSEFSRRFLVGAFLILKALIMRSHLAQLLLA